MRVPRLVSQASKVRSLTLDVWTTSVQRFMCAVGNERGNAVWENASAVEALSPGWRSAKPTAASTRAQREKWIRAKYMERVRADRCFMLARVGHAAEH